MDGLGWLSDGRVEASSFEDDNSQVKAVFCHAYITII